MKLFNKYFIILLGALLTVFTSCTEDVIRELSPVQEGGIQAYFSGENQAALSFLPSDPTEFKIIVGRQNTKGAETLELVVNDSKNLLVLDDAVTFADGEALAELNVDFSAMQLGQSTTLTLEIKNEADRYWYGISSLTVSVLRDYDWESAGSVEFEDLDFGMGIVKVPIEHAKGTELFRLPNLYHEITVATDDPQPVDEGYHLQFYIDTLTYAAKALVSGQQNMGTGYNVYWNTVNYAAYCSFTNYGSKYSMSYLLVKGTSLYLGGANFTWKDGFPGVEPDPYSGEDVVIGTLSKTMTSAAGMFVGYEDFSYYTTDIYGSDSTVYVAEYLISLNKPDDQVYMTLDMLTFFDGTLEIPAGVYNLNSSDDGKSVRVGNASELPYGSYVELPSLGPDVLLYLVSGTVTVSYDESNVCTITVDAVSGKGSVVKTSWTGSLDIPEPVEEIRSVKRIKRGNLSLLK